MAHDRRSVEAFFNSLSPAQRADGNRKTHEENQRQAASFREAYARGECYLCGCALDEMRSEKPCTHWLLRRCKFRKTDFPKIYARYGYINIVAFLRWCANAEVFLRNINDLHEERAARKVISETIRWKNVEWTFDCTNNDFLGHGGKQSSLPHYHFQMRIDGRQFIKFSDFHVPLHDQDLFILNSLHLPKVHHGFGTAGAGMQEAISVDPEAILEEMVSTSDEGEAQYHLSTLIEATDKPIPGELLASIIDEAKQTGRTFASVARLRLGDQATIQTVISPSDAVPIIAARTENKPR